HVAVSAKGEGARAIGAYLAIGAPLDGDLPAREDLPLPDGTSFQVPFGALINAEAGVISARSRGEGSAAYGVFVGKDDSNKSENTAALIANYGIIRGDIAVEEGFSPTVVLILGDQSKTYGDVLLGDGDS